MRVRIGASVVALASILGLATAAVAEQPARGPEAGPHQRGWIEGRPAKPSNAWSIAFGGRLYDNWAETLGAVLPKRAHPLYPARGKKKGAATWRCKECHGWDTNGVGGAYRAGGHRTGIKGLRALRGGDRDRIIRVVRGPAHGYGPDKIPDWALAHLARFLVQGQIETERYVDYKTGKARGSAERGMAVYQNICAVCHGFDGRAINFKTAAVPEFVGTVAREAPWELMHKLRNGQPGAAMPAFGALTPAMLTDLIAYAQTLPVK